MGGAAMLQMTENAGTRQTRCLYRAAQYKKVRLSTMQQTKTACRLALIRPADASNPIVQTVFGEIERELGFGIVPNIFRAMANQPPVLRTTWDLFRATVLHGNLPRTVKEMIGIVVSAANGSAYALAVHMHSLGVQGIAESTLASLASGATTASGLPPSVAAIIRVAHKAAHSGPLAVEDSDISELSAEGLDSQEIAEVFAAINLFQYINSFTDLCRVPIDAI